MTASWRKPAKAVGALVMLAGLVPPISINDEPRPAFPGRSLLASFAKEEASEPAPLYFRHQDNRALRRGDWKIVASGKSSPWELYDLSRDRSESVNLADQLPDLLAELVAIWTARDAEYAKQGATGSPLPRAGQTKAKP